MIDIMFGDIRNVSRERLDYAVHPGHAERRDIIVLGHGVTGHKDRPLLLALAESLAQKGIHALRLSFSGNGESEGRFAESTISKEVQDLGVVLDALAGWRIGYAGHSMGGAVGVIRTSTDPRIRWLVSLAGMVHTQDFATREFGAVKPGAGLMWDKPGCPLSQAYLDDMAAIQSVARLAPKISVPWLLVHGTEDDVVPLQDTSDIFKLAQSSAERMEISGANHLFEGEFLKPTTERVANWFQHQLAERPVHRYIDAHK